MQEVLPKTNRFQAISVSLTGRFWRVSIFRVAPMPPRLPLICPHCNPEVLTIFQQITIVVDHV